MDTRTSPPATLRSASFSDAPPAPAAAPAPVPAPSQRTLWAVTIVAAAVLGGGVAVLTHQHGVSWSAIADSHAAATP